METEENSYIWYATFYKKYGDLINPYERVSVNFIPTINEIYQLVIERDKFEDNEIKISEEEAIEIAKNKDNEIEQNREIINIEAEMGMAQVKELYSKVAGATFDAYVDNYSEAKITPATIKTSQSYRKTLGVIKDEDSYRRLKLVASLDK